MVDAIVVTASATAAGNLIEPPSGTGPPMGSSQGQLRPAPLAARGADHSGQAPRRDALAPDIGVARLRALLVVPVDPFLRRVDIDERQRILGGPQRHLPGKRQQHPAHLLHLAGVSPGERVQEWPSVEGARIPEISSPIAPCCRTPMSLMLSAPATIPAIRQAFTHTARQAATEA
jgi:hypothetical protein